MSSMVERIQGDLYGNFAGSMDDYKEIAEVAAAAASDYLARRPVATVATEVSEVSHEEAVDVFFRYIEPMQAAGTEEVHLALIRAVRDAIGAPAPLAIPEGWELAEIVREEHDGKDEYSASLCSEDTCVTEWRPTWQAALAAACTSAQEGGK